MQITKEEFLQWKNSLITNEVFGQIRRQIQLATSDLVGSAGIDPDRDRYLCGMIKAWSDILEIDYEGDSEDGS